MEKLIKKIDMGYQLDKRDMDFLKFAYKALFYDCSKMLIMFLFALATHRGTACLLDHFLLAGLLVHNRLAVSIESITGAASHYLLRC